MRRALIAILACGLFSCGSRTSGPEQANNGSQQKTTSTANQNGGRKSKTGKSNSPQDAAVKVPDPRASNDPNTGHQAGVGDDPSNLEVNDPNTGTAGSGGRQGHATR